MFEWDVEIDFTLDLQNLIVVIFVFFCVSVIVWILWKKDTKQCSHCKERIRDGASVCRYCRRDV
jgi:hypothetical protein